MTTTKTTAKKGKQVGTEHVDQLVRNYKKERWVHNTERLGKPDSLSTWYGLEELSSFLELARDHHADGIKVYYGVYPENYPQSPELQGRQTVVFVATKEARNEHGLINKDIYIRSGDRHEILAFNYGKLCPPFCTPFDPKIGGNSFPFELSSVGLTILDNEEGIKII